MESCNPGIMSLVSVPSSTYGPPATPATQDRPKHFVDKIKKEIAKTGKTSYSFSLSFFSSPVFLLLRASSCSASRACCAAKAGVIFIPGIPVAAATDAACSCSAWVEGSCRNRK